MTEPQEKRLRLSAPGDALERPPRPPSSTSEPPLVLYKLKRVRRPENWQFMRLVPRPEFASMPVEKLTSDEAASAYCLRCKYFVAFAKGNAGKVTKHMERYHPDALRQFLEEKKRSPGSSMADMAGEPMEEPTAPWAAEADDEDMQPRFDERLSGLEDEREPHEQRSPGPASEPPLVLYEMRRVRRPENWQFMRLVPRPEFASMPIEDLTSDEAAHAYCLRCKCFVAFAKGKTMGVSNHMKECHSNALRQFLEEKQSPRRSIPVDEATLKARQEPVADDTEAIGGDVQTRFNERTAQWLAESYLPFDIVEDTGFRNLARFLTMDLGGVDVSIPDLRGIAAEVDASVVKRQVSLKRLVRASCDYYSLAVETWTSSGRRRYVAVRLHFVDEGFNPHKVTLDVKEMGRKRSVEAIATAIGEVMLQWRLDRAKCLRLVGGDAALMPAVAARLGIPHGLCIARGLHLAVSSTLMRKNSVAAFTATALRAQERAEDSEVEWDEDSESASEDEAMSGELVDVVEMHRDEASEDLDRCVAQSLILEDREALSWVRDTVQAFRDLVVFFTTTASAKRQFARIRDEVQPNLSLSLILDCPLWWPSSCAMLGRLERLRETIDGFFDFLSTPQGQEAFGHVHLMRPTTEQWLVLKCVRAMVHPLTKMAEVMRKQDPLLLSDGLLFGRGIRRVLEKKEVFDCEAEQAVGEYVQPVLERMHHARRAVLRLFMLLCPEPGKELRWISYLDPRGSRMAPYTADEVAEAREVLLTTAVNAVRKAIPPPRQLTREEEDARYRERFEEDVFGCDVYMTPQLGETLRETEQRCDRHLDVYLQWAEHARGTLFKWRRNAGGKTVPQLSKHARDSLFEWWRDTGKLIPVLSELARKWLGCVVTAVPNDRAFAADGSAFAAKRAAVAPATVRGRVMVAENGWYRSLTGDEVASSGSDERPRRVDV